MTAPEASVREHPRGELVVERGDSWNSQKGFATLRYAFKPASVDETKQGVLSKDGDSIVVELPTMNGEKTVLRGGTTKPKETECLLIWDGKTLKLEPMTTQVVELRHSREENSPESKKVKKASGEKGAGKRAEPDASPSSLPPAKKAATGSKSKSSNDSSSSSSTSSSSSSSESDDSN